MFGDSNGQIKLRAKQRYKFLSATDLVSKEDEKKKKKNKCLLRFDIKPIKDIPQPNSRILPLNSNTTFGYLSTENNEHSTHTLNQISWFFTKLFCLDMTHKHRVAYSTVCCLSGHPSKYCIDLSLLTLGNLARTSAFMGNKGGFDGVFGILKRLVNDFFLSSPIHQLYDFCLLKLLRNEWRKGKDRDIFKVVFLIFEVYKYFVVWNVFLNQ